MNKLFLINKPNGMTSHDVIYKVRKASGVKKVGHGGTLDPMAQGLLIVGVGREATKKLGEISLNKKKTYLAQITLGEQRDTDDIDGEVINKSEAKVSKKQVKYALKKFVGTQQQVPPNYSAIKIKGQKAYFLARKGKKFSLKPRIITVYSAKLIDFKFPLITAEFEVSSGTYIRALARDIGRSLGTFAYLSSLVRTRVGEYDLKDAISLGELEAFFHKLQN